MIRDIRTREELESAIHDGRGFLYNDFGGRKPELCPIHAIVCPWVATMLNVKPGRLSVPKIWSDSLDELVSEIRARGKVHSPCKTESALLGLLDPGNRSRVAAARGSGQLTNPTVRTGERVTPRVARHAPHWPTDDREHCFIRTRGGAVELWSRMRLPFDPRGWLRKMRNDLAGHLRQLEASPGQMLHATYVSDARELVDVENVLFYNVGFAPFSRLATHGVRFERAYAGCPRAPEGRVDLEEHYVQYRMTPEGSGFKHWKPAATLASWRNAACPSLDEFSKLADVWLGMKHARPRVGKPPLAHGDPFGLRMEVRAGGGSSKNITAFVKPLLDGIVAAFQSHDGTDLAELARRAGSRLGHFADDVGAMLMDDSAAVLGRRRLLWRWRDSVQWNPGDDRCVAAEVLLREDPSLGNGWRHSGEIFAVVEAQGSAVSSGRRGGCRG